MTKHEGWANWETWNLVLHLSNTQAFETMARATVAVEPNDVLAADALRKYAEELMTPRGYQAEARASLMREAVRSFLDNVVWPEVVEHFRAP